MSFIAQENVHNRETCRDLLKNVQTEMLEQAQNQLHYGEIKRHDAEKSKMSKLNLLNKADKKYESKKCKKRKHKKSKSEKRLRKISKYNLDENDESNTSRDSSNLDCKMTRSKKTEKSEKNRICGDDGSSHSSEEYEWIEAKNSSAQVKRDNWMTEPILINTYIKECIEKKPNETYDPAKSSLELNRYWKTTGTGLPNFQKPCLDDDNINRRSPKNINHNGHSIKNWKKANQNSEGNGQHTNKNPSKAKPEERYTNKFNIQLNGQQMNELGAKIIKAEIANNLHLAEELKQQLGEARQRRAASKEAKTENRILLTPTACKQRQGKYLQTYESCERMRYSTDDKRCNLQELYLREKYTSAADANREFLNIARKQNNNTDDLDDIFSDHMSKNTYGTDGNKKGQEMRQSILNQQRMEKALDSCNMCTDSSKMQKQFLVSMGQMVYLTLPWHIGLQANHCIIAPIQHVSCSTELDENAWLEMTAFRKTFTKMCADQKKDVIFYEIANRLHKKPHLTVHCIPIDRSKSEMAPFYFKKAIEESEREWSINKQLISLKDKGLLKCVPKGLPYFWVNFNMDNGFAHIIEDEDRFPSNFAQEIIGGMLNLESHHWRKLRKEHNSVCKTKILKGLWEKYY